MMKKRNLWLLTLGMGLSSGTILVERFLVDIPNWLAIIFAIISIIALLTFFIRNREQTK